MGDGDICCTVNGNVLGNLSRTPPNLTVVPMSNNCFAASGSSLALKCEGSWGSSRLMCPVSSRSSNTGTSGGQWNEWTTARSEGQRHTPPTTKSRPLHAEGTACDSPPASPAAQRRPGKRCTTPSTGRRGRQRVPPPGTHPSVDTPCHPLPGRHAPPQSRHQAPAPHLAHGPARRPAAGRGDTWHHDQTSVAAERRRPHVQARRPSHP